MVSVLVIALVSGLGVRSGYRVREAATLASHRVRPSSCRVRPTDPVRPGGCRRRYVSRSPLILNGSTRSSMLAFAPRAATREDERYLGRPACTTPTLGSVKHHTVHGRASRHDLKAVGKWW